jgi:aconitate hydratase
LTVTRPATDPFGALASIDLKEGKTLFYRPSRLEEMGLVSLDRLPFSIRILLECTLRHAGKGFVSEDDVRAVAAWSPTNAGASFPFMPTRVILQDFTGVPAVVDLASMRSALGSLGGDPKRINPVVPVDLVIDHSVQVDFFGAAMAFHSTWNRSSSGIVSATPCSDGPRVPLRTSGWYPRERASSTR